MKIDPSCAILEPSVCASSSSISINTISPNGTSHAERRPAVTPLTSTPTATAPNSSAANAPSNTSNKSQSTHTASQTSIHRPLLPASNPALKDGVLRRVSPDVILFAGVTGWLRSWRADRKSDLDGHRKRDRPSRMRTWSGLIHAQGVAQLEGGPASSFYIRVPTLTPSIHPIQVLRCLSEWVRVSALEERGTVPGMSLGSILAGIQAFERLLEILRNLSISALEHILTTPLPFVYSVHIRSVCPPSTTSHSLAMLLLSALVALHLDITFRPLHPRGLAVPVSAPAAARERFWVAYGSCAVFAFLRAGAFFPSSASQFIITHRLATPKYFFPFVLLSHSSDERPVLSPVRQELHPREALARQLHAHQGVNAKTGLMWHGNQISVANHGLHREAEKLGISSASGSPKFSQAQRTYISHSNALPFQAVVPSVAASAYMSRIMANIPRVEENVLEGVVMYTIHPRTIGTTVLVDDTTSTIFDLAVSIAPAFDVYTTQNIAGPDFLYWQHISQQYQDIGGIRGCSTPTPQPPIPVVIVKGGWPFSYGATIALAVVICVSLGWWWNYNFPMNSRIELHRCTWDNYNDRIVMESPE
ncbi:hypothetical protein C8R44DRAFT_888775 [Mycena epipterygia]|nr:hypothetical protein C8R44DRAFT_888775 [Mycena epipterygia]